jgi:hypothetical protein
VGPEGSAAELARFVAEDWVAAEAAAELANSYGRSLIACPFLRLVLFGQIPYELVQTPPWNSELLAGSLLQMVHWSRLAVLISRLKNTVG